MLGVGVFVAAPAADAQPALEQFRLDPPRLCLRDAFRWGFSYRGFPGGLAAVKQLEVSGRWEGTGEPSIRSLLTPTRDDLQRHAADEGRFESYLLHWSPPRKPPGEIRYTLRVVLADGREVTTGTSARYEDGCPPPARQTTLAAGPTGRIGFQTATPTTAEFLQGVKPAASHLIWGDLQLPLGLDYSTGNGLDSDAKRTIGLRKCVTWPREAWPTGQGWRRSSRARPRASGSCCGTGAPPGD
jgi:hypothetical protein